MPDERMGTCELYPHWHHFKYISKCHDWKQTCTGVTAHVEDACGHDAKPLPPASESATVRELAKQFLDFIPVDGWRVDGDIVDAFERAIRLTMEVTWARCEYGAPATIDADEVKAELVAEMERRLKEGR